MPESAQATSNQLVADHRARVAAHGSAASCEIPQEKNRRERYADIALRWYIMRIAIDWHTAELGDQHYNPH